MSGYEKLTPKIALGSDNKYQINAEMSFDFTEEESRRFLIGTELTNTTWLQITSGNLDGLKFLDEIRCPIMFYDLITAAARGHLEMVQWLIEEKEFFPNCSVMIAAIVHGHLDVAKFLLSKGCELNRYMLTTAIEKNQLEIVEWLRQNDIE